MMNTIRWFEIPAAPLDRAQAFFRAVLGRPTQGEAMGPSQGAVFDCDQPQGGIGSNLDGLHALA
jgi:predicted enzyme related to lactoylglutathione lyase